jgi:hypothetical protein
MTSQHVSPTIKRMSYAVLWSEGESPTHVGKLELRDQSLVLEGLNGAGRIQRELAIGDIMALRIGRSRSERLGGRPVLALQLADGRTVRLATLGGAGALHEVADHISGVDYSRDSTAGTRPPASR